MKRHAFVIAFLAFFALSFAGAVQAQPEEAVQPEGAFRHDGLFLRFQTGFGLGRMVEKEVGGRDISMSGTAGAFRFQLGGAALENLMVYGEVGGFSMTDPTIKGEEGYITTTSQSDVTLTMSDLGLGACYYFMPVNIYLSASVTVSRDRLEIDEKKGSTNPGVGAYVSIGKEWWVSDNWGLGVALFAYASRMDARESGTFVGRYTVYNTVAGVVFSATYN
jgi:hypothetical protein